VQWRDVVLGLRWQSAAAIALSQLSGLFQSGVALRLPPQSMTSSPLRAAYLIRPPLQPFIFNGCNFFSFPV
jgi:hypothetical protein